MTHLQGPPVILIFPRSYFLGVQGTIDRAKNWHIEGNGKQLVLYRYNDRAGADKLRNFLEETSSIARAFVSMAGSNAVPALR